MIKNSPQYLALHQQLLSLLIDNKDYELIKEKHQHIAKKVEDFWGSQALHPYINNLFEDTREGHRHGFSQEISSALMRLLDLHDTNIKYKEKPGTSTDMWESMNLK